MNPRNIKWYAWRAKRKIRAGRKQLLLLAFLILVLVCVGHQAGYIAGSY